MVRLLFHAPVAEHQAGCLYFVCLVSSGFVLGSKRA